jgi:hypothetical protein
MKKSASCNVVLLTENKVERPLWSGRKSDGTAFRFQDIWESVADAIVWGTVLPKTEAWLTIEYGAAVPDYFRRRPDNQPAAPAILSPVILTSSTILLNTINDLTPDPHFRVL